MSSPMIDLPDHFPMPIDADGNGPASEDDAVETICWCGEADCRKYLD